MAYPIGTPGTPWGSEEKVAWRASVERPSRLYTDEVLSKIELLKDRFDVHKYGALPYDETNPDRYPLYVVKTRDWSPGKPSVLITGGVHGYETSGVQGALRFLDTKAVDYTKHFNICVVPCVSPWGYERIQRWNAMAVDPNRSFDKNGPPPAEEAKQLMAMVASCDVESWIMHIDLHETTDTDETEFRPAKAARDGESSVPDTIPDGFYCVGDTTDPVPEFQKAVIDSVRKVTHIAPPDANGKIIGEEVVQPGVINYPLHELGLCASMTGAKYTTTTEVYPDSPKASDDQCNDAQVAAVVGGLDYLLLVSPEAGSSIFGAKTSNILVVNAARFDYDGKLDFSSLSAIGNVSKFDDSTDAELLKRVQGVEVVITKEIPVSAEVRRAACYIYCCLRCAVIVLPEMH
jgi:hypothetical protein